ncbi:hypothetical protein KQI88_04395 [Alkaliphilus sp. MSJ-5]|uniref:Uncharacterized protein n=1 Tax=Alkaliphilus flagellatus TaxID=2841507 RepID=A0ABS6FZY9_9FIRM|nr:hypothetical protein [Alkaliphilus flagellatus]MBU5675648.1 hypothetical protein [Alkaliphilus flagellatus]
MDFYVLAKCVDSEKGDIIIDLSDKVIKIYKALYQLKEDQEYQINEDVLTATNYFQWDVIKSYELAFGRGQNVNKNGFRFLSINERDSVRIDNNGLLYINNLFFGKFVNKKEVDFFQSEGVHKFKLKLESSKKEGIKLLVKGKKIYRIFTRSKLKSLQEDLLYGQNLLELIEEKPIVDVKKQMDRIEADLKQAKDLILRAIDTLTEIKRN